ncbi:MAG: 16S rRNA methyltransferase [Sulfolobaceae archaeon]
MKKLKFNLILLESALELVPNEIINHPAVLKNAKKRNKKPNETILDISLHYFAMRKLKEWKKRGRPDIIHQVMLSFLLESEAIKGEFYIHTFDSRIIKVNPIMRPPKNYYRFISLMEQLLLKGRVPPKSSTPLMEVLNISLSDIKKKYKLLLMWEKGKKIQGNELCNYLNEEWIIGIGGFPHGDFSKEILDIADEKYSIADETLEAFQVVNRIVCYCGYAFSTP